MRIVFIVMFVLSASGFAEDNYENHLARLKPKAPEAFTIVVEKPFVVIGDEEPEMVKKRARTIVRWTVEMLKQDYFDKDPETIIDIWLFKDDSSYYHYTRTIFGDKPNTPFGYYSESENAIIMNISTGGGTLVHEMVHPFMRANFPECPAWFNEGLASLYEQCIEKDGHIHGLTNWRLQDLQIAIREKRVPSFKKLTSMTDRDFYTKDKGTNYGQARYLCYYLQEKGLLVDFYHRFYRDRKSDPTGYETLKQILGIDDMDRFKKKWEGFVLKLTFP